MKRLFIILLLLMPFKLFTQDALPEDKISYRPPTVAGTFYPSDSDSLRTMVEDLLDLDVPGRLGYMDITGLVAPHAGYVFSGEVAARAYKELKGKDYDVAVIIAPSHHESFKGASVFSGDAYVTPLGNVMVDKETAEQIAGYDDLISYSMAGHRWKGVTPEHSLEVQLPFLQIVQPGIKIVPIIMGSQDFTTQDVLMRAVSEVLKKSNKKYIIIASTDLSHFHDYETAQEMDKSLVRTFARFDYFAMQNLFSSDAFEACGAGPLTTMMMIAEQLGATNAAPIIYLNSGDTDAGKDRKDRVVGYFSGALVKMSAEPDLEPYLEDDDKQRLLDHVKDAVRDAAHGKKDTLFYGMVPRYLAQVVPAFVTLKENGELRACMGHTFAQKPLVIEVQESAQLAATSDYRFGSIKPDELDKLEYEVTVMSRMRRILNFDEIEIGKDGLFIRNGNYRGLLLPQVASERNWDSKTFLENLSQKAGMDKNGYLQSTAQIFAFRAVIFSDSPE